MNATTSSGLAVHCHPCCRFIVLPMFPVAQPSTVIPFAEPGNLVWRECTPFTNSTALSPSSSPSAPPKEQVTLRPNSNAAHLVRVVPSDANRGGVRCVPEWDTHVVLVTLPKHRIERWRRFRRPANLKRPHAVRRRFLRDLWSGVEHGQMWLTSRFTRGPVGAAKPRRPGRRVEPVVSPHPGLHGIAKSTW